MKDFNHDAFWIWAALPAMLCPLYAIKLASWALTIMLFLSGPFCCQMDLIIPSPFHARSMALESVAQCGAGAFQEVRVQSLVVEFLLTNVQVLFSDTFTSIGKDSTGTSTNG